MTGLDFDRSLAVMIGIDQYGGGISPLQTAVSDARAIAQLLQQKHNYQILSLLNGQATLASLQQLFQTILPQKVTASDRLLVYFAGHGIALNGEDGPEGFLIPQDARLGDSQTYLPMVQLQQALVALPCRHCLIIFDCCFAGAFRWSSTRDISFIPEVIHQERYERFILDPAWQVITSAAHDQLALDSLVLQDARGQQGQHSPFALALMEALAGQADAFPPAIGNRPPGDGVITATELYLYLRDRVEAPTHQRGQRQTPGLFPLGKHDKGEYIFLSPGHVLNLPPAPPLDPSQNPYRGLESFDEEHAALFFGRGDRIAELQDRVLSQPLTIVVGTSGSGKSSLVKAGLLPLLRKDPHWQILGPLRPGSNPLALLAGIIHQLRGNAPNAPEAGASAGTPLRPDSLALAVGQWQQTHPQGQLLLVVDQFEELLTLGCPPAERVLLLDLLAQAFALVPQGLHIVLTLRADFEPQFQDTALAPHWSEARFILAPMDRADLREAIEQPASAKVMYFQSDDPRQPLVEQIINEVADMPGALPLLSFTLSELYLKFLQRQQLARQRGTSLDRAILEADYRALGGVVRSLTQRADQEYEALVQQDPAYAHSICHVMLRMVALGGGEVTRRRVPLSELSYPPGENERAQQIIQQFSAARLLVKGQDLTGQAYVEPAHDALVRGWKRLVTWQREEENLGLQRRLTPAALDWEQAQKPRFLWARDPRLDILGQILKSPSPWFNRLETDFIRRSIGRKMLNRQLWIGGTIAVIGLLSAGLITALMGQRQALISQAKADRKSAIANLRLNHSLDGLLDGLAAGRSLQHPLVRRLAPPQDLRDQVQGTLQWAMFNVKEQNRFLGHRGPVRSEWSPDGQRIATAGEDGWIRLWNAQGQEQASWQADPRRVWQLRFSPDGQAIATAGDDGSIRLWSLSGQEQAQFLGHQGAVHVLSFSPDGQLLASGGSQDGQIFLWRLPVEKTSPATPLARWSVGSPMVKSLAFHPSQPRLVSSDLNRIQLWNWQGKSLGKFEQHAWAVVFTADGQQIAAAGDDGQVEIWDLAQQKQPLRRWRADNQRLWDLTLSADGKQIATAGEDGRIKLWSFTGQAISEFRNHTGPARSVSFAPDTSQLVSSGDDSSTRLWFNRSPALAESGGQAGALARLRWMAAGELLLSGGQDGQLRWWSPAGKVVPEPLRHSQAIQDLDGDAAERWVASLTREGMISLWDLTHSVPRQPLELPSPKATGLALHPQGQWLAIAERDGGIRLWDIQRRQFQTLRGQSQFIRQLRFSPEGQRLATAGSNGLIEVWDIGSGRPVSQPTLQLQEHIGQVLSIAFSPANPQQLVSGGADGTIRLWDLEAGKSIGSPFQLYEQQILTVAFSPDGLTVATGDRGGYVQLWDIAQQEQRATWQAHGGAVQDIQFRGDGQQFATVGSDGLIKIWPMESFEQLMEQGCDRLQNFRNNLDNGDTSGLCDAP